jgi:cytochrome c oxidase subunit II
VFRLAVIVGGTCLLTAGFGGKQSTLAPDSGAASDIGDLWWWMLAGSVVIFGAVVVLLVWAALRRHGEEPAERSSGWLGEPLVLIGGAVVPTIILVALFAATLVVLPKTSPAASPPPAAAPGARPGVEIAVTGRQWFWDVDYPSLHVRTANEIHLPAGETATLELRTKDVAHSFWVPALNRKLDMIPGQTNTLRIRPHAPGTYRGQCAEFCGLQHAHMAFDVIVEPRKEFERWATREARPPPRPTTVTTERGQQVFLGSACVYCHTIAGTNASGRVGPDLSHVASRLSLAAGTIPNTTGYLAGWILDPQHVKPGNKMPATAVAGPDFQALLAYLETLR